MELRSLSWDSILDPKRVLGCLERLETNEQGQQLLKGLKVHISANPRYYVTTEGQLSLPIDLVF